MTSIRRRPLRLRRLRVAGAMGLLALLPLQAYVAAADVPVSHLRLRLRADVVSANDAPSNDNGLAELGRFLGYPLAASTRTSTGDEVLRLKAPVDVATAKRLVNALRMRSDVVWAEIDRGEVASSPKPNVAAANAGSPLIYRLIVTFADPALAQASRLDAKLGTGRDDPLSAAAGTPLHVARATVGGAWIVELFVAVDAASAQAIAARLEEAGLARFAAADYVVRPMLLPNDPYLAEGSQWNLVQTAAKPKFGIDATRAWDVATGSPSMVIAVIDTGVVAHPDLTRVLPGYTFITDPVNANDGDGRDADATDPGDWRTAGICPAPLDGAADSDWHGTLVSGIVAADTNNGVGIAGIDWQAQLLPVRALGRCGGTFSDILAGMTWAAGLPVPGVPANPHPAKVINMSLGGEGLCTAQIQSMINAVLDAGTFITVAAGNDNAQVAGYVPANCLGVSTVVAIDPSGARASYSNFGLAADIAAPGGDIRGLGASGGIPSTWNSGKTVAAAPAYVYADGTSVASPHVAGVASLMLAVNPGLQPAQIKSLMAQTAAAFADGSDCAMQGICGAGVLNAYAAVKAAQSALMPPLPVVEFYYAARNHYFISAAQTEIAAFDNNVFPGWQRTGFQFKAYSMPTAGANPVCRFYIPPPYDSHFYSASAAECAQVQATYPFFDYESPNVFYIALPDQATGACPPATIPVYRLYNNGQGGAPNHRYTTSAAVKAQMIAQQWVAEGYGPDQVIMCSPQ